MPRDALRGLEAQDGHLAEAMAKGWPRRPADFGSLFHAWWSPGCYPLSSGLVVLDFGLVRSCVSLKPCWSEVCPVLV